MKRYLLGIIITCILLPSTNSAIAQKKTESDYIRIIEVFLDSVPGVTGKSIDYNDFFAESYITAKVYANENGNTEKIKFQKCKTTLSGNCDKYSISTAKKLLYESSKNIICNKKWNYGKNKCKIVWKPRHSDSKKKKQYTGKELQTLIEECVTTDIKKELHGVDGSAYLLVESDSSGIICNTEHIGNIFWETNDIERKAVRISGLKISFNSNNRGLSTMYKPYSQRKEEQKLIDRNKIFNKCARLIGEKLIGKKLKNIAECEAGIKKTCIEININAKDVELEYSNPTFPGGAKELKQFLLENLKSNKIIKRSEVKGVIEVELSIKKNGKAKVQFIWSNVSKGNSSSKDCKQKIVKAIYNTIEKTIKKMPRWTPATYEGKVVEMSCKFKLKLE